MTGALLGLLLALSLQGDAAARSGEEALVLAVLSCVSTHAGGQYADPLDVADWAEPSGDQVSMFHAQGHRVLNVRAVVSDSGSVAQAESDLVCEAAADGIDGSVALSLLNDRIAGAGYGTEMREDMARFVVQSTWPAPSPSNPRMWVVIARTGNLAVTSASRSDEPGRVRFRITRL